MSCATGIGNALNFAERIQGRFVEYAKPGGAHHVQLVQQAILLHTKCEQHPAFPASTAGHGRIVKVTRQIAEHLGLYAGCGLAR